MSDRLTSVKQHSVSDKKKWTVERPKNTDNNDYNVMGWDFDGDEMAAVFTILFHGLNLWVSCIQWVCCLFH